MKNNVAPVYASFIQDGQLHTGRVVQNYRNGNLLVWTNDNSLPGCLNMPGAIWLVPPSNLKGIGASGC